LWQLWLQKLSNVFSNNPCLQVDIGYPNWGHLSSIFSYTLQWHRHMWYLSTKCEEKMATPKMLLKVIKNIFSRSKLGYFHSFLQIPYFKLTFFCNLKWFSYLIHTFLNNSKILGNNLYELVLLKLPNIQKFIMCILSILCSCPLLKIWRWKDKQPQNNAICLGIIMIISERIF
jgi:hypothetical protein